MRDTKSLKSKISRQKRSDPKTLKRIGINNLTNERRYKIFCVNGKYGIQIEFRIFYFIHLPNEEYYERKESSSAR